MRARRTLVGLCLLGSSSACSTAEDASKAPPGPIGGLGTGNEFAPGDPEGTNAAGTGGEPPDNLLCHPGSVLTFDVGQSHRTASAAYASAAVSTGAWPLRADMSQLQVGDFVAAFGDPLRPAELHAGFLSTTPDASQGVLFVFPPATEPKVTSLELFVVVDTTASMRNELALAGRVVEDIAKGVDALDASISVTFGIAALGATSERFSTLQIGDPSELSKAFDAFLNEPGEESGGLAFKDGQLGPFVGLDALDQAPGAAFSTAVDQAEQPHVLVLTDGGFAADEGTVRTIDGWTKSGAHVSFAQLHAPKAEEAPLPTSFRGELLATLAARGGGGSFFITDANLGTSNLPGEDPFRVPGISAALLGPVAPPFDGASDDAAALISSTPDGFAGSPGTPAITWMPHTAPVAALAVDTCGAPPSVTVDGVALGSAPSAHLELIGKVVTTLQRGCDAKPDFGDLTQLADVNQALKKLITKMGIALEACE